MGSGVSSTRVSTQPLQCPENYDEDDDKVSARFNKCKTTVKKSSTMANNYFIVLHNLALRTTLFPLLNFFFAL